jgi:hypothetical protein
MPSCDNAAAILLRVIISEADTLRSWAASSSESKAPTGHRTGSGVWLTVNTIGAFVLCVLLLSTRGATNDLPTPE